MEYRFTYSYMSLMFLLVWIVLFWHRKDVRREMLMTSLLFTIVGPLLDIVYIQDWWHPGTLTGTPVGPDSLIAGFASGGVAAVIYEEIFKMRLKPRRAFKPKLPFWLLIFILVGIFYFMFYVLNWSSHLATYLTAAITLIIIYTERPDLIIDSAASGILMLGIAIVVYTTLTWMTPGWIGTFYLFENVPPVVIMNVPIDDFVWYLLAGFTVGPLYEYWQGATLVSASSNNRSNRRSVRKSSR